MRCRRNAGSGLGVGGLLLGLLAALMVSAAGEKSWPHYLGPTLNGQSAETGIQPGTFRDLWKASVGIGYSGVSVADGCVFTMGNIQNQDTIYCLDAATGQVKWKFSYPCELKTQGYEGPYATPTVADGKVYTLSKYGHIFCLNAATGAVLWKTQASEFKAGPPQWGCAGSPTVVKDLVVFDLGDQGIAFEKDSGKVVWQSAGGGGSYSSPVPFTAPDQKTGVAIFVASGVVARELMTGRVLWQFPWKTAYDVNAPSPLFFDDKLFVTSGYGAGCALLQVGDSAAKEVWRNKNLSSHFGSCVYRDGYIYGMDGNVGGVTLKCLDAKTGEAKWAGPRFGMQSFRLVDGKLLVLVDGGVFYMAEASPTGYRELAKKQLLNGKCWHAPTFCDGQLYARNLAGDLVCVGLTDAGK